MSKVLQRTNCNACPDCQPGFLYRRAGADANHHPGRRPHHSRIRMKNFMVLPSTAKCT